MEIDVSESLIEMIGFLLSHLIKVMIGMKNIDIHVKNIISILMQISIKEILMQPLMNSMLIIGHSVKLKKDKWKAS